MTREELIQEELFSEFLHYLRETTDVTEGVLDCFKKQTMDRILSREKLLLEKIGKPLRDIKYRDETDLSHWITANEWSIAIDEALAIIEKESI